MPADPEASRLKAIARQLTSDDLKALEEGRPVYSQGYGLVLPQDLKKIDKFSPGWRKRLKSQKSAAESKPPKSSEGGQSNVVYLPLWPEPMRGIPNSILRSALFGAIRRGRRKFLQKEKIAACQGITILQTGPQLDQADLDVWEQCLHLARNQGLDMPIQFAAHGFLKAIGRSTGKSQHEWLKSVLRRLMTTLVEISTGERAYAGQLIHHWYRNEVTGYHVIELNPKIALLYGADGWSQIEWEQRLALKGMPLAQWLHGFYSSHARPYPIKVKTLRKLCGSETKQMYHFRAELRGALQALQAATGWTWSIDEKDLVRIDKNPT